MPNKKQPIISEFQRQLTFQFWQALTDASVRKHQLDLKNSMRFLTLEELKEFAKRPVLKNKRK